MYNIRYHIASLVSVFLALALGLVLGGLIVDKTSTGSQSSLVTDLKQEFTTLRSDNDALQATVDAYTAFSNDATKEYMNKMLEGKTIAVLGLNNKATEIAHDDITTTGGKAALVDINLDKLDMKNTDSQVTQMVTTLMAEQKVDDAEQAIANALVVEWTPLAKSRPLTDALIKEGVLTITDYSKFKGVDGVIDTAIDGDKVNSLALKISDAFRSAKKPALCASLFQGDGLLAKAGWKREIASTNMLSTPIGTYTIAAIMTGADDGLYGTIEGAKAAYPKMRTVSAK